MKIVYFYPSRSDERTTECGRDRKMMRYKRVCKMTYGDNKYDV